MEDFAANPKKVREKSVYLLHLDAPRIILVASVFLGIVVATFLFGINFSGHKDGKNTSLTHNDSIFDPQKELDLLNKDIPAPPDNDGKSADARRLPGHDGKSAELNDKNESKVTGEIWKGDNLNNSIIPARDAAKDHGDKIAEPKKKGIKDKKEGKDPVLAKATDRKKQTKPKKAVSKKKNPVVEVSSDAPESGKNSSPHYAIQVASFDKKDKADGEIRSLKDLSYDAYMNKTNVGNKKYYRVRIGPVLSKDKAIDLMNKIQKNERYSQSYIIRE